jgi:hypothetical protein
MIQIANCYHRRPWNCCPHCHQPKFCPCCGQRMPGYHYPWPNTYEPYWRYDRTITCSSDTSNTSVRNKLAGDR